MSLRKMQSLMLPKLREKPRRPRAKLMQPKRLLMRQRLRPPSLQAILLLIKLKQLLSRQRRLNLRKLRLTLKRQKLRLMKQTLR